MTSRKSGDWAESEDDPLLLEMREESMLRVRKCLKLTAFYAQLYLQSQDKHLVHVSRSVDFGWTDDLNSKLTHTPLLSAAHADATRDASELVYLGDPAGRNSRRTDLVRV
jgi:hypothetical protein